MFLSFWLFFGVFSHFNTYSKMHSCLLLAWVVTFCPSEKIHRLGQSECSGMAETYWKHKTSKDPNGINKNSKIAEASMTYLYHMLDVTIGAHIFGWYQSWCDHIFFQYRERHNKSSANCETNAITDAVSYSTQTFIWFMRTCVEIMTKYSLARYSVNGS